MAAVQKSKAVALLIGAVVLAGIPSSVPAQTAPVAAPILIPLAGNLKTPAGDPRTGTVRLVLSLYDAQDASAPLWVEQQLVTLDAQGGYAVQVGATVPEGVAQTLFTGGPSAHWIGVGVENEAEQLPRLMLVSVPYAAKAASADTLSGKAATDFVLASTFKDDVKAALRPSGTVSTSAVTANFLQKGDGAGGMTDATNIFENGGNFGVGTTTPLTRFHVAGGMSYLQPSSAGPNQGLQVDTAGLANGSNAIFINAPAGWTGSYYKANLDGIEQFSFFQNGNAWFRGNLGLGTSTPVQRLHVVGGMVYLQPSSGVPSQGLQLDATGLANGSNSIFVNAPGGWSGNYFKANVGGAETFAIAANGSAWFAGNVGVGTPTPASKLHVAGDARITGNVTVDGNIGAKYQDVAEWVDAVEPLEAGTLVVIDAAGRNRVKASGRAYDAGVAGAVSPKPGLVLGEPGEGRVLVAQSGRVRVKADARYGAIRPGDLLVSSPRTGYAMRSRPVRIGGSLVHRPGTLIGKALEPLEKGDGEILVLLTLQ